MSSSSKKLLAGKFQLVVRPIFNGMSLSHHCSQVAVGTQGTRAGNSRHDIAILRLLLQKLEEEHRSGNIGHLKARPPHVHQLPPVTSGADILQILGSQFWEGAQTSPPDTTSPSHVQLWPQLQIEFPDCHMCQPGPPAQDHLARPFVLQFSLALPLSPFLMQLSRNPLISIAPNEQQSLLRHWWWL